MDLIGEDPVLNLRNNKFRIYSKNQARAPQFVGPAGKVENSMISEGCIVNGTVVNSILSGGVVVEEGAEIYDSVVMDDVIVRAGASVYTSIVDSDSEILSGAIVGKKNADKTDIAVIAKGSVVAPENM
jgi:glucose-1-phosphate adenylyltransferase